MLTLLCALSAISLLIKRRFPHWHITLKNQSILLVTIAVLVAVGIRVGIVINTLGVPQYTGMAVYIGEGARNLAEGRGYVVDSVYVSQINQIQIAKNMLVDIQDVSPPSVEVFTPYYGIPPGPSIVLAATYKVFGEYRYIYWRILQAVITSIGCLVIFFLGRELFNRRVGIVAAWLYAVYLPIAYISGTALHDSLLPFLTLLALYLFVMGTRRRAVWLYVLSGLTIGISCYFQPTLVALPVVFGLGLFVYTIRKRNWWRSIFGAIGVTSIILVVVILTVSPWVVRNYNVTGKIMLMRPSLWQGVWEGFGEYDNPVGAVLDDVVTYEQAKRELGYDISYGTPEYDAYFQPKSIAAIREHPAWWFSLLARRFPHTLVYGSELGIGHYTRDEQGNIITTDSYPGVMTAIGDGVLWETVQSHSYAVLVSALSLLFTLIPFLFSIAAIGLVRRQWRTVCLLVAVLLYFSAINVAMFVNWKVLVPGATVYILFSAVTLDWIIPELEKLVRKLPGYRQRYEHQTSQHDVRYW
jgi:4-amino-4-deoxy-L-arabinose transferase-like glycosyltransferase